MIISYFKSLIFIILVLSSLQNTKEEQVFTITQIGKPFVPCLATTGSYDFYIEGVFSEKSSILDKVYLDIETSDGRKFQSMCTPFSKTSYTPDELQCNIEICLYPLDNVDIILPTKAPNANGYSFPNWESTIGASPGTSNVISKVTCLPKEKNIFIPSSIDVKECSGNNNTFTINGEWSDKTITPALSNSLEVKIVLDNEDKDIAECDYDDDGTPIQLKCEFNGEGDIKIKEQYFEGYLQVFKINAIDSNKKVKKCGTSSDSSNFLFLNKILIIFGLLIF